MNLDQRIKRFDLIEYLCYLEVDYKESGKNITKGNIGLCCPSPECDDNGYHFAINPNSKVFNCWKCGVNGNLIGFIKLLEECPKRFAIKRILERTSEIVEAPTQDENLDIEAQVKAIINQKTEPVKVVTKKKSSLSFPPFCKDINKLNPSLSTDRIFLDYIKERRYTVEDLAEWDIKACRSGRYSMRLIFPIYIKGQMVTYLGRDITDKSDIRYRNAPNDEAVFPTRDVLYGYDYIPYKPKLVAIVEGAFDTIRVGKGLGVGILGKVITKNQKKLLISLEPEEVVTILDGDSWNDSEKTAWELTPFFSKVSTTVLPYKEDPDSLGWTGIQEVIRNRKRLT